MYLYSVNFGTIRLVGVLSAGTRGIVVVIKIFVLLIFEETSEGE